MFARFWLLIVLLTVSGLGVQSQCLTDFEKLLPEPSTDYTVEFGRATAIYEDIMAVSAPNSDKSVRLGGVVYLYRKVGTDWVEIGILEPSNPQQALLFGYNVEMSENYIIVGAYGYGGRAYVFKKPPSGWTSAHEIAVLSEDHTTMFAANWHSNTSIDMSADEQTLLIGDASYDFGGRSGAIFIYHKSVGQEWNNSITPTLLFSPESQVSDFGSGGVAILEDRVVTSTAHTPFGGGSIYVFNDNAGHFNDFQLEAILNPGTDPLQASFTLEHNFVFTPQGIFVPALIMDENLNRKVSILFFEKPADGWHNNNTPCLIYPTTSDADTEWYIRLAAGTSNPSEVYASFHEKAGTGKVLKFTNTGMGWCHPNVEVAFTQAPLPISVENYFGSILACNQNASHVVMGRVPLPDNPTAQLALVVLSKEMNNTWSSNLVFNASKSTVGHFYGRTILGFEDYLFVGAPYDGTIKANGGIVYSYKKSGTDWIKTGRILPPFGDKYDNTFGTALATNGEYIAIGASGFDTNGKVLIYKKTASDWSTVELIQEISPPESLNPFGSGDNVAMNDRWLLIPAVTMVNSARIHLSIYEFNGTTWDYFQSVEIGYADFSAWKATVAVDIENETIVVGGTILQQNSEGQWQAMYLLYPSDKEPEQISPDFTHWITNGDRFGHSVDIDGDNIFIGAPTKDDGDTWDVGAVYVFTRKPGFNWSSGTETAKILPRVRDERELFGYSLKAIDNTLIVGAPGADYYKDGSTGRNKPGRAYIFQSKDFYWQDVVPLLDFSGDSFVKDYFGVTVNLDATDFFIGSSIEDNAGDQLSGSVYITPTPPIIKLVPPVCISAESIDLVGYPFGGRWEGPGIIDNTEGIFDPKVAGVGIHEFTYQTPSCTYLGRLRIEVKAPPAAILVGGPTRYICEDGATSTTLLVEDQPDAFYHWYYREQPTDQFAIIDGVANSITVSKTGEYRAKVYNKSCETFSSIVAVVVESNPISIPTLPVICDPAVRSITLTATPTGGTWTGNYVSNNTFNAATLPNGNYAVKYAVTSTAQCHHFSLAVVKVDRVQTLGYVRSPGNLCDAGTVQLSVVPNNPNLTFEWSQNNPSGSEVINNTGQSVTLEENGSYQVKISNAYCSSTLPPFVVDDKFSLHLKPEGRKAESCSLIPFFITSDGKSSDTFTWLSSENENGEFVSLNSNNPQLEITESGFYKLEAQRGVCLFTSDIKHITIFPGDSLFVPNVFTPNKDGKNDVFRVATLNQTIDLKIMNRYGQKIFEGDGIRGWDGDDSPTGTYFWQISFADCNGNRQTRKGPVQLFR